MAKLIGYAEMKKTEGKICFTVEDGKGTVVGQSCERVFLYGDVAKKINNGSVGKEVSFSYGCGYNGKAFVADVTVR